jgi:hypothetical protein
MIEVVICISAAVTVVNTALVLSLGNRMSDLEDHLSDASDHLTDELVDAGESLQRTRQLVSSEAEGIRAFIAAALPKKRAKRAKPDAAAA